MEPMMKSSLFALLLAAPACGGTSSTPVSATANTDPVPMAEPPPAPVAGEPATPAEPPPAPAAAAPDPVQVKAELLAAEMAAYEKAKPVFEKWCASCHSKDGKKTSAKKRGHFDMTTYPFGGHHAMEISSEIREVLGLTGKKPTMPPNKKGAVQGEELELIKAWADAFDAAHEGGAHDGHGAHGGDGHHGGGHKH